VRRPLKQTYQSPRMNKTYKQQTATGHDKPGTQLYL